MKISLKAQNKVALWTIVAANFAVFATAVKHQSITFGNWGDVIKSFDELVPIGLGLIMVGILNAVFTAECKTRIVFGRWRNALPGCEAFTRYAQLDPRIDVAELSRRVGPFPIDPLEQNRLWYKLYRQLSDDAAIAQVHREYLFARDYASLALMMFLLLGGAATIQIQPWWVALGYTTIPLIQFVLATIAARNHGRRFVQTVLAITCTQEKGPAR